MVINCWPAGLQSLKFNPSEVKLFHKRTMAGKHVGKSAGLIMPTMNTIQHVRNEQSKRNIADMRNNMLQEGKKYSLTQDCNQAAAQVCVAPATPGPEQSMEEDLGKRKLQAIFKDEIRLRAGLDSNPILNTGALFTWNASWSMSVCHQNGYQGPRASPTHLALQLATHTARIQPSTRGQTVLDRVGG